MNFFISNALAETAAPPAGGGIQMFILIGVFFVIMYFMIIRPQSKRAKDHKQLIDSLSKGDEVVTTGGMLGKITNVGENFLRVEVSDGVELRLQKSAISNVLPKGTLRND